MNNTNKAPFYICFLIFLGVVFTVCESKAKSPNLHFQKSFQAHKPIEGYRSSGNLSMESFRTGDQLITAGADGYVKIWSLDQPDSPLVIDVNGPDQSNIIQDGNRLARSLAVNVDQGYFVAGVGLNPSKIQVRDFHDGSLRAKYESPGDVNDLEFLPNSDQIIQPYTEGGLIGPWAFFVPGMREMYAGFIRFETDSGAILSKGVYHWNDAEEIAVSPNGEYIATGAQDGGVGLWDARTGDNQWVRYHESRSPLVSDVAFGTENEKVYSIGNDHMIKAWSVEVGWNFWSSQWPLWSTKSRLNEIEVDPKGRFVAGTNSYRDERHFVAFFDPDSGEILHEIEDLHDSSIEVIEITEDGSRMITGARDGTVKIWKIPENFPEEVDD